jgi:hypothetical protein
MNPVYAITTDLIEKHFNIILQCMPGQLIASIQAFWLNFELLMHTATLTHLILPHFITQIFGEE